MKSPARHAAMIRRFGKQRFVLPVLTALCLAPAMLPAADSEQPEIEANLPANLMTAAPLHLRGEPAPVQQIIVSEATAQKPEAAPEPPPASTNKGIEHEVEKQTLLRLKADLEAARHLRATRQAKSAIPLLTHLMLDETPETIRRDALLELGYGAQDENDLSRAQTVFSQFLSRWPNDRRAPEILLRQGQIFRQMGLNNLALAKFYAVMTAALSLKTDQIEYYQKLVLKAQLEIAESNYLSGKYTEAADFFSRLLKQNNPDLDRPQTQYRLIRALAAVGKHEETSGQAEDFLGRYPDAPQLPEVRFLLALALKQLGRNTDALHEVLVLLKEEKQRTQNKPELWAYWQQRAGNEIANQFYRDGDYTKALDIYVSLAALDKTPRWQLPVSYQVGMTYERLMQPEKALVTYGEILKQENELGTNSTPGLKAVLDMARWRISFLKWHNKAETDNHAIANPPPFGTPARTSATSTTNTTTKIASR